mmetsp:Transcript_14769/g.21817  ORF Transcript_14769/g.21817 Transcript_14769/m.21817 type:complete len:212 (-) Transcript_14769:577-1212(-)
MICIINSTANRIARTKLRPVMSQHIPLCMKDSTIIAVVTVTEAIPARHLGVMREVGRRESNRHTFCRASWRSSLRLVPRWWNKRDFIVYHEARGAIQLSIFHHIWGDEWTHCIRPSKSKSFAGVLRSSTQHFQDGMRPSCMRISIIIFFMIGAAAREWNIGYNASITKSDNTCKLHQDFPLLIAVRHKILSSLGEETFMDRYRMTRRDSVQ